jgi:hypothetical protein
MKGVAIASVLVLGSAASFTAIAASRSDSPPDVERGVKTLRVESRVDNTCQIWINSSLRVTMGSFGDSGILSTAPTSPDRATELLVRRENATSHTTLEQVRARCDLVIDPEAR